MAASCILRVNGRAVTGSKGQTLVDAALRAGVVIPHDCRTGDCETCAVSVVSGGLDDAGSGNGYTVLACQAKLTGDVGISFDEVPSVRRARATVRSIRAISPRTVEVKLELAGALAWLPGQYLRVSFPGLPARDYSPTVDDDGSFRPDRVILQIRRLPGGVVSSELGRSIRTGSAARIEGPFGHAFYRKGAGRLVLLSSGTGWAPIWSIARQACLDEPDREIVVIASARDRQDLYMRRPFVWLGAHGVRDALMTASAGGDGPVWSGRAIEYLEGLRPTDLVYVAGAPGLVDAVRLRAERAGARCHADPFLPSASGLSLRQRALRWFRQGKTKASELDTAMA